MVAAAEPSNDSPSASASPAPAASSANTTSANTTLPRVFLLDAHSLAALEQRYKAGDKTVVDAVAQLDKSAKSELNSGPFSVVNKDATPPSGDKHDYMSQAPYFWPNPNTPDGLPYVSRDGERNPEILKFHNRPDMGRLSEAVETLGLAYYFTGDETYADKAAKLIRAWYLDPETKMNPNLEYAQFVPGANTGRGAGVLEGSTGGMPRVIDAIGLLAGSKAWTEADQNGMVDWFKKFIIWMRESKNGKAEAAAKNNHGTHYDLQNTCYALFVGDQELAKKLVQEAGQKRIAVQIEPDGKQPLELARTHAWGYSLMNLNALITLANLGEHVGVDLWSFKTDDGRSIRQAIDYLVPFAGGEQKWTYKNLGGDWSPRGFGLVLQKALVKYPDDERYKALLTKLPEGRSSRLNVLLREKNAESRD